MKFYKNDPNLSVLGEYHQQIASYWPIHTKAHCQIDFGCLKVLHPGAVGADLVVHGDGLPVSGVVILLLHVCQVLWVVALKKSITHLEHNTALEPLVSREWK